MTKTGGVAEQRQTRTSQESGQSRPIGVAVGLIARLLTAPLVPVKGVLRIGDQMLEGVGRLWLDPTILQAHLIAVQARRDSRSIAEEADRMERAD